MSDEQPCIQLIEYKAYAALAKELEEAKRARDNFKAGLEYKQQEFQKETLRNWELSRERDDLREELDDTKSVLAGVEETAQKNSEYDDWRVEKLQTEKAELIDRVIALTKERNNLAYENIDLRVEVERHQRVDYSAERGKAAEKERDSLKVDRERLLSNAFLAQDAIFFHSMRADHYMTALKEISTETHEEIFGSTPSRAAQIALNALKEPK